MLGIDTLTGRTPAVSVGLGRAVMTYGTSIATARGGPGPLCGWVGRAASSLRCSLRRPRRVRWARETLNRFRTRLGGFAAAPAEAQQRDVASVEVVTGYAGYVDDAWDNRAMVGAATRFALTPRFTIGPGVIYLRGRRGSHDVTVTDTGTFDLVRSDVSRRVVPLVGGPQ